MSAGVNLLLSIVWIASGAASLWTMLRLFGGEAASEARDRVVRVHRWSGRLFVALYIVLLASMLWKIRDLSAFSALSTAHLVLALALAPLLVVKILIARRWKPLHKILPALGLVIAVLAFVTAALGWMLYGPVGRDSATDDITATSLSTLPGTPEAKNAFTRYCGQCHSLSRPLERARTGTVSEAEWRATLGKMERQVARRGARLWTPAEGDSIVKFLAGLGGDATGGPAPGVGDDEAGDDRGRRRGGRGTDD